MRQLKYGVPQGSVMSILLFNTVLFINSLLTQIFLLLKSLKQLNKNVSRDLKLTVEWVRANKPSLNANETEIIIFKPRNKTITRHLGFRLSGLKIKPTNQVKYSGVILQNDLHWNKYLSNLGKKLSRSVGLSSKIRHYVTKYLLRMICFSIFNSH